MIIGLHCVLTTDRHWGGTEEARPDHPGSTVSLLAEMLFILSSIGDTP